MTALKRLRDFKAPVDAASQARLREQLGTFEQNAADAVAELDNFKMARLKVKRRITNEEGLTVAPGQSLGITLAVKRVQLEPPGPQDAGKFLAICKGYGIATNTTVYAPTGSLINGAPTFVITTSGLLQLIYCDGVDYWAVL